MTHALLRPLTLLWIIGAVALAPAGAAEPLAFDRLHEPAPDFTYVDGHGRVHHLKDSFGQPLLLHLWATWCRSCKTELPELMAFAATLKSSGVALLAVAIDQEAQRQEVNRFLTAAAAAGDALIADKTSPGLGPYLTWGLPVTYLIAGPGVVVARALGAREWGKGPAAEAHAGQIKDLLAAKP